MMGRKKDIIETGIVCRFCKNVKEVNLYKTPRLRYIVCQCCNSMLGIKPRTELIVKKPVPLAKQVQHD